MTLTSMIPWILCASIACAWWLDGRDVAAQDAAPKDPVPKGKVYRIDELERERAKKKSAYLSFLNVPALSTGLYVLDAGATDGQSPHARDEIYYVVEGKGKIRIADATSDVQAGSVIYVKAGVEHRFLDIEKKLTLVVVFAG